MQAAFCTLPMNEKLEIYTKGTKAWFKDPQEGYIVGSLIEKNIDDKKVVLKFVIDSTKKVCITHVGICL
jgi:hypothetical protein